MYLFEEDVVHYDHGGHVGVGTPHHSELRRPARWAGRVLRVGGVHRAHMLRAGIYKRNVAVKQRVSALELLNVTRLFQT